MQSIKKETPVVLPETKSYDGKVITDSLGRKLTLRKPSMMDKYYLRRALGTDSSNMGCMAMMTPILYVAKIDDAVLPTPHTFQECSVNLTRLGDEGCNAAAETIFESMEENEKEEIESIKK